MVLLNIHYKRIF